MNANNQEIQNGIDDSIEIYKKQCLTELRKLKRCLKKSTTVSHTKIIQQKIEDVELEISEIGAFGYFHISPGTLAEMHRESDDNILRNPLLD
jgi:hypothetical protein